MDVEERELERAAAEGDGAAAERLGRARSRSTETVYSWLEGLVGKLVNIEGLRVNYRGILHRVIRRPDGGPDALVFQRLERVSWFQKNGPEAAHTFIHKKERLVPWEVVLDIGEEGFGWAPETPGA
jgi:hypothetical protein